MIWTQIPLVLVLTFEWVTVLSVLYRPNDDAHGLRMALNDDFIVAAFNHENKYYVRFLTTNKEMECVIPYKNPELYVYSLCVLKKKKKSKIFSFVQISENSTSNEAILSRITFTLKNCNNNSNSVITFDRTVCKTGHKESMILEVDPQEKYAYVFADSFMLTYDLMTNKIEGRNTFYAFNKTIIPTAVDLTNEWAFMIGYTPSARSEFGYPHFYTVDLLSQNLFECNHSDDKFLSFISTQNMYSQDQSISVSIDPSEKLLAMGVSSVNEVYIFEISHVKHCSFKSINNIQPASHLNTIGIGFGRSVSWLDHHGTLAILVHNFKNQVQPESEIHVFKTGSKTNQIQHIPPDYIFPNNQQMLPKNWTRKSFLFILAYSNNLLILCDNHRYLYLPHADAGSRSVLSDQRPKSAFVLEAKSCVSGSYKETSDIGPCTVCPPGTKNSGDHPSIKCEPCSSQSFCPLGSTGDVPYDEFMLYKSYNQTFEYPETPIIDDYDDILMRNFFVLEDTIDCMLKLPRIWTFIAIVLCFIVWLIMFLIKRWQPTRVDTHRQRAKIMLKQIDIIGEGEQLVGGLASLVVLIIIIHSCWFANDYFYSYPIESAKSSRLLCRNNQTNTKFDNGLQLPLPTADGNYGSIFDMLNKQKFTMTIHLINTAARCDNITVERLRHIGTSQKIPIYNCTLLNHNITGSFTFNLSTHTDLIQVSIEGPFFIGALRICLYGPKSLDKVEAQKRHRVEELDACTLFYTDNQTIGLTNNFNINLIKVINITEPLRINHETNYTGRWAPYFKYTGDLSDEHYLKKDGKYLRYTSPVTTFNLEFTEEFSFLLNNQSPIVRLYELIFHTFLFNFLIIDIVAMIFIIYTLWCQPPLRRLFLRRCNVFKHQLQSTYTENIIHSPSLLIRSSELQHQFTVDRTNIQSNENCEQNERISDELTVEHLIEYFGKRFQAVTQNIERLRSDVDIITNQINELIPNVNHLKHHITDIHQININENNENVGSKFSVPQIEH